MRLVLDGMTAFEYWMSLLRGEDVSSNTSPSPMLTDFEGRSAREITERMHRTDGAAGTLELLVCRPQDRRQTKGIACRYWAESKPLPAGSICHIGDDLYSVSPELCLVRLATMLPRLEFLRAMTDLLGIYGLSFSDNQQLFGREPLTTKERIATYLDSIARAPGTRTVRSALNWVPDRSASPRETTMDLDLYLPTRLGGQGLPLFKANLLVPLAPEARELTQKKFLVADLAWSEDYFMEYNSSKYHDDERQKEFDFEKITAFQRMGKTITPVSNRQFNNYVAFSSLVDNVRDRLKIRDRYSSEVEERRRRTHANLIRLERGRRKRYALNETARWRFLLPYLDLDSPL